jgi:hypothetical protein
MKEPSYPAVRDRGDRNGNGLAGVDESITHHLPPRLEPDQAVRSFDQRGAEQRAGSLDKPAVGLLDAARDVAWAQAAEPSQLLSGSEAIESTDLSSQDTGGYEPNPRHRHQCSDNSILFGDYREPFLGGIDLTLD